MKISWITSILVICFSSIAFSGPQSPTPAKASPVTSPNGATKVISPAGATKIISHVVTEDETAWFLAQVYYGSGAEFPKLLASNQLTRAEDMKQGMTIRIENPKFHKQQSQFAIRYVRLWEQRQKALGLQVGSSLPHAKVVIPTEKIRTQDNTPKLPFTDTHHSATSATDHGNEELVREPSASTKENDAN